MKYVPFPKVFRSLLQVLKKNNKQHHHHRVLLGHSMDSDTTSHLALERGGRIVSKEVGSRFGI